MKFSEIHEEKWPQLRPYLDTCLLPVTGLTGTEEPWLAASRLEKLRDVLDLIEIPFKGRVVTYPAFHYLNASSASQMLTEQCVRLREAGFTYIVIAALNMAVAKITQIDTCDLIVSEEELAELSPDEQQRYVNERIAAIWHTSQVSNEL